MRRFFLLSALLVAATLLACDEDPVAPATTGGISLRVVMGEQPQQSPALHTTAPTEIPGASAASTSQSAGRPKVMRSELSPGEAPNAQIRAMQLDQVTSEPAPADQPAAAPSAPSSSSAIDDATIYITGPTSRTLTGQTPGETVTIDGLDPGSYTVVLLGLASGALDHYGRTTVNVVAGENRTATITFTSFRPVLDDIATPSTNATFPVTFPPVPGADSYIFEIDTSPDFAAAPGNATYATPFMSWIVPDTGTYYVRARAVNDTYAPNGGGWSNPESTRVIEDQDPSGSSQASAYDLGFASEASTTFTELNILPEGDEDWYSLDMCLGDMIVAETWAQRHDPGSALDTYLELYDPAGSVVLAENDDLHADTLDSRLEATAGSAGMYYLRVFGPFQSHRIGQYDLSVQVIEGEGHVNGSCATLAGATNGWTGASTTDSWSDPANWLTGDTPTATDTVSIPTGATPVLTENVTVAGLIVQNGGDVETDGYDLTVTGDLSAGNSITGNGTVILTGTDVTLSGGVPNLLITGEVSLSAQAFSTGNTEVEGTLRMNGHQMAVGGTFSTINGSGMLEMTNDADTLAVAGPLLFNGGSTDGSLTAGTIITTAGVSAQAVSATFAPSGSHRVVLAGAADRTITDAVGLSYFNDLALQTTGTVTVAGSAGQAQINGLLVSGATTTPTVTGGNLLAYGVAVQNMVMDNAQLIIGNGTITALDGVIFRNFPAGTQQLIVNRDGGNHTFNNLQFSQDNGASDVYIEAGDTNTGDGDQLTITLAGASPIDGGDPLSTNERDAVVNWVVAQAGPPAQVAFTVQPSDATAGSPISPAVEVTIQDDQTITVDTSTAEVTISFDDNPSGGALSGSTSLAAVNGVATFSDLAIEIASSGYTLLATSPGLNSDVSAPFTIFGGSPTTLLMESGDGQTAAPDTQLPDSLAVKVVDAYGNGVAGVEVTWAITTGTGSLSATVTNTDAAGIATTAFTLGSTLGTYTVDATSTGLTGSPVTFTATASNVVTWLNAADGNWSDGTNWSTGSPPTASEAAVISVDGTYTVTVDADVGVESITLGGAANGPTVVADGWTVSATGTVRINDGSVLSLSSGTLEATTLVNEGSLELNASVVNGAIDNRNQLTGTSSTTLNGAITTASGSTILLDGSGADVTFSNGFTNNGTVRFTSAESSGYPSMYVNTGTLVNATGGKIIFAGLGGGYLEADLDNRDSLKVQSAETVSLYGTTIDNSGVMYAGTAELDVDTDFINSGIVSIGPGQTFGSYGAGFTNELSGDIQMDLDAVLDIGSTTFTSAVGFTIDSSLSVYVDGSGLTNPSVSIAGDLTVGAGGTVEVLSNTVTVDSLINHGDLSLDVAHLVGPVDNHGWFGALVGGNSITGSLYSASNATLEVSEPGAELTVDGNLTNDGTVRLFSSATGTAPLLTVTGGTLTHNQWFDSEGPAGGRLVADSIHSTSEIHAVSGGLLTIEAPAFFSEGWFTVRGADILVRPTTFTATGDVYIYADRTLTVDGGTFDLSGALFGNGTLDVSTTASFTTSAYFLPGDPDGNSVGTLSIIGDVVMTDGGLNVNLEGTAPGTEYDVLNVSGAITIAGQFNVAKEISPTLADTFTVLNYGSRSGTFGTYSGLTIDDTLSLSPRYGSTAMQLVVTTGPDSLVLSPSSATLTGVGDTEQLGAMVFSGDEPLVGVTFTWSSLNENVATVDETGLVTAVASGQATIKAEAAAFGLSGYALITVSAAATTPVNLWDLETSGTANQLLGVWGLSDTDIFAVGRSGTILHDDGTGWTAMNSGTTTDLYDVWGSDSAHIYAVGNGGIVLRYDGSAWSEMTSTTSERLWAVWGASPDAIFAVGDNGTIVKFDGSNWTAESSGTSELLGAVWGTSATSVYAVGYNGTILDYDGGAGNWVAMDNPAVGTGSRIHGIWGTSDNDIYAAAYDDGAVLRWDGASWTTFGTSLPGWGIWGTSGSDIFTIGGSGGISHYDGSNWTAQSSVTTDHLHGVFGFSNTHVSVVGDNGTIIRGYRGATVTVTPSSPATLTAIDDTVHLAAEALDAVSNPISGVTFTWSSDDEGVATVDPSTGIVTAVANGTTTIRAAAPGGAEGTASVTVDQAAASVTVSPDGVTITTDGGTQAFTAEAFDANGYAISSFTPTWQSYNTAVATIDPSTGVATAVASGQSTIEASTGAVAGHAVLTVAVPSATAVNVWTEKTNPSTASQLLGIGGVSDSDIFMGGDNGTILHYDGSAWTDMNSGVGFQVREFWGFSDTDVFAVGGSGIARYNGSTWSNMSYPGGTLYGVWGASPTDVYAVGSTGTIYNYDGSSWASVSTGTSVDLWDVWGSAADDIFAVGSSGTILHYDGASWTSITNPLSGTAVYVYGVWGTAWNDVYAACSHGYILHYDGASWSEMSSSTSSSLWGGVWGTSSTDVYALGSSGTIVRYDGSSWTVMDTPNTWNLRDVWGTQSGDLFVPVISGSTGDHMRGVRGATVANYGNYTEFADTSSISPNYLLGSPVTVSDTTELTHLGLVAMATGENVKLGLYSDNGGEPDQLLVAATTSTVAGRMEISIPQTLLPPGTYWYMANYETSGTVGFDTSDSNAVVKYIGLSYSSDLPTTYPAATTYTGQEFNYYLHGFAFP